MSKDFTLRGSLKKIHCRFILTETTQLAEEAILLHNTDPVASHVWASALTTTSMLSALLTGQEKYSIRWNYNGAIESVVADVNANNEVRGIPKNSSLLEASELEALYGNDGSIALIKAANGKVLSSGTAKAAMLNVVDDVSFFMSTSDQIETEATVAVEFTTTPEQPVKVVAGFMMQALPDCDLEEFETLRVKIKEDKFTKVLLEDIGSEVKLQRLIRLLTDDNETEISEQASYEFAPSPVYKCNCSQEKMRQALTTVNKAEIQDLLDSPEGLNITCDFCRKQYTFREI